jgi:hypothetical protein
LTFYLGESKSARKSALQAVCVLLLKQRPDSKTSSSELNKTIF